ncbi:MAG: A/G-specific adenine glycosylase [Bacteroidetes bacterium]|nr:MAG: A/G-specific adenine glycosylase [Bacteroidota bacterium]
MNTAATIINWYRSNKRDLPWRNTKNPYFIWISEVVLQQTRVEQGTSYYLKFIKKFPTVKRLASATESEVLKLWQGLGYYSRARNMHAAAKEIVNRHKGKFPTSYDEIIKLKGIGEYTAAAISSFAFHLPKPVLDGNVYRFISRYFGIHTPIQSSKAKNEFLTIAAQLLSDNPPHEFNQAIMEFGALQCKPGTPDCKSCPLQSSCYAFEHNAVTTLPVKNKKIASRNRYFYYLVIRDSKSIYLRQRIEKDIWQNLFEYPLIETKTKLTNSALIKSPAWKKIFKGSETLVHKITEERKHVLSHQVLHTRFVELSCPDKKFSVPPGWEKVRKTEIKNYALPRLIDRYMQEENLREKS